MRKLLVIIALSMTAGTSFGQGSADANATAKLIRPIIVTKQADLDFGAFYVLNAGSGGTLTIDPSSSATRSYTTDLRFLSSSAAAAAYFTLTGEGGYGYIVTLPTLITVTSGSNSMNVDNFKTSLGTANTGLFGGTGISTSNFYVGATIHASGTQPVGTYSTAAPFTVTVNYN